VRAYQRRRRASSDGSRTLWIVVGIVLILGVGGTWLWLRSRDGGTAGGPGPARDTATARAAPAEPSEDLPELEASDELVQRLAAELSSRPRLAEWLATDQLVRRFVGAVVRVAAGNTPLEPLDFVELEGRFRVREQDRDTAIAVVDPATFARYAPAVATFVSLDTEGSAELYRRLHPLFVDAYRELGFREPPFDETMALAVQNLLDVPVPEGPLEVVPAGGTAWAYRDARLEELLPAQKLLLRMGPENARRVQAKLRELAHILDLPEPRDGPS
jgi:hypothetical protein